MSYDELAAEAERTPSRVRRRTLDERDEALTFRRAGPPRASLTKRHASQPHRRTIMKIYTITVGPWTDNGHIMGYTARANRGVPR